MVFCMKLFCFMMIQNFISAMIILGKCFSVTIMLCLCEYLVLIIVIQQQLQRKVEDLMSYMTGRGILKLVGLILGKEINSYSIVSINLIVVNLKYMVVLASLDLILTSQKQHLYYDLFYGELSNFNMILA